jgi:tetratricopeptide (TPR) repeat protein
MKEARRVLDGSYLRHAGWSRGGLCVILLAMLAPACARGPHPRHQHLIDDELVATPAVRPDDYAAYLRVRLALDTPDGDLEAAKRDMDVLVRRRGDDPHLWTTKAELEHRLGDADEARAALDRAFALRPDYGPARALEARMAESASAAAM